MYNLNLSILSPIGTRHLTYILKSSDDRLRASCAVFTNYSNLYEYITSLMYKDMHQDDCKNLIIETLSAYKQNNEVTWSNVYAVAYSAWGLKGEINAIKNGLVN